MANRIKGKVQTKDIFWSLEDYSGTIRLVAENAAGVRQVILEMRQDGSLNFSTLAPSYATEIGIPITSSSQIQRS